MNSDKNFRISAVRRMQNKIIFTTLLLLPAFIFSCSGGGGMGGFSMPPMPVEVATVSVQTVLDRFEAVGTVEASESITVVSEIDAKVTALPFREGEKITKTTLIAQLDDAQLTAEYDRASALEKQAKSSYDRVKSIVDQGAGARQDLDDAYAAMQVASANLALAKARLEKTRITAPFTGLIGARKVSTGSFLRIGQTITDLANIDQIRVNFTTPERYISRLHSGAEVSVSTTAFPGYQITGKIIVIEPVLDAATRSARIVALVQNPDQKFRPGMSANVSVVMSERNDAITIPNEAVFGSGNQSFVYVVKADSTVMRAELTIGMRMPEILEVLDGLEPKMLVVRAGHQKLYEGAKVIPVFSQPVTEKPADAARTEG